MYLTVHPSPTHTRAHLVHTNQDEQLELKLWTNETSLRHKHSWSCWREVASCGCARAAERHWASRGANRPLYLSQLQKSKQNQLEQSLLSSPSIPFPCLLLLVWTGLLKPMRNLILQTYFADVSVETLGGVADCPFLCQYYSRNTDCLQPMAPHSQTTILDERLSIHCNSCCLYNRCGSTDVYVLYSRVHFYYLQIKDCVEEDHVFFSSASIIAKQMTSEPYLTWRMWIVTVSFSLAHVQREDKPVLYFLGFTNLLTEGKRRVPVEKTICTLPPPPSNLWKHSFSFCVSWIHVIAPGGWPQGTNLLGPYWPSVYVTASWWDQLVL